MTQWRHDIHAHPEPAFEERRTADLVARRVLLAWKSIAAWPKPAWSAC